MEFIWTQSALKDFEKEETCPKRWEGQWVLKSFSSKSSEAMDNGNAFEFLCIGKNAKDSAPIEIKTTKSGEKTALQKRMEIQAERFKNLFDPAHTDYLGYIITGTQVKLKEKIAGIDVEGTADILAQTDDKISRPVILDIKATEDAYNVRSPYGWGNPIEELDLIQQVLYSQLYYRMTGVRPLVVLLIFEIGTQMRVRVMEIEISEDRYEMTETRFLQASEVKKMYDVKGYSRIPSEKECEGCPLICEKRMKKEVITKENYKY